MSAIDQKHLIEIVAVNVHSGTSKASGKAFSLHKAQCVVRGSDNSVQVGELFLPQSIAETTKPGKYLAEFELAVNFDREVVCRVIALHPLENQTKPQAKPAA